ncbi:MAG: hypothetical protein QXU32_10830 [Nitrososphaerales archaeon]
MELKVRVNRKDIFVKGKSAELATFVKHLFNTEEQSQTLQTTDANLPTVEQIVSFLEEQDFKHTMHEIMQRFYKRLIDARKERCRYDQLYKKVRIARKFIEQKYNGRFVPTKQIEMNGSNRTKSITLYIFQRQKLEATE